MDTYFKILTDNRLIFAITVLVVAFMAYQLSLFIWKVIPLPEETVVTWFDQSSENKTVIDTLSVSQKTNQIANSYLFGRVIKEKTVAQVEVQDAPKSSLNYKIRGIYYSTDKALASVILQKNNKDTIFYRLGDEIDANIYIQQINADNIIITRQGGRLEKLILEKPIASLKMASRDVARTASTAANLSSVRVLQSYKRRYSDNPLALAKRFQAIPVSENGRNIGYKLKALRGERLLKKLNLQADDVFVAVNGIGLDKPFQALDALKSLTTAENVSLTVIRNGNRETLDFNLK